MSIFLWILLILLLCHAAHQIYNTTRFLDFAAGCSEIIAAFLIILGHTLDIKIAQIIGCVLLVFVIIFLFLSLKSSKPTE